MTDIPGGAWGVIGAIVAALLGVLFGRNGFKRDSSSTKLSEAEDTQQVGMLAFLNNQLQVVLAREERALQENTRLRDEMASLRIAIAEDRSRINEARVGKAAALLPMDQVAQMFVESGLMQYVERKAPPRPPPPSAHDPFQANVVYGRRATDQPLEKP